MERCFVMLKPGVVNRRIVGEVISRFERKGLKLIGLKMMNVSKDLAAEHYVEHNGKEFYQSLIDYITSGPVIAMAWESAGCVSAIRRLCGPTKVEEQMPGTIRGDFCIHMGMNVVHASDSPESGEREVSLWFNKNELCNWSDPTADTWI
ncbi:MAG: nucleoside-diphosphate kinase [Treponema sp. CETP13]|nr:MAG: nucleoside-diphosphate kinase [Treponema sp. CETP13]